MRKSKILLIIFINLFNISLMAQTIQVEPTQEPPVPGLAEEAISIYLGITNGNALHFEEGVEGSSEVLVRLFLPNLEFDVELEGAPKGMQLLFVEETNNGAQKIYKIVWKPGLDAIPDASIPSIRRFLTLRVNVGGDKMKMYDLVYTLHNSSM